jgi:hypothetical protein
MGIELPPELADVAAETGVAWPEADEEAMTRQAQAWRDAATSMSTLATDADTTARSALSTVSGPAATAASTEWKTFVEPDSGHLTSVVRDCTAAADRLEHAATQVATAKVEIVRNLVDLAQNADAAHAAASAGHPVALAGLDTAIRGTAANVAHIETQLVTAVQPGSGVDMAALTTPVNAGPGHHLLPGVPTTATDVVIGAADQVASTADRVTHLPAGQHVVDQVGHLPAATTQTTQGVVHQGAGLVGNPDVLAGRATQDVVHHGAGLVGDAVANLPAGQATQDVVRHGAGLVGDVGNVASGGVPGSTGLGDVVPDRSGGHGGVLPDRPGDGVPGQPVPGADQSLPADPDTTGRFPVQVPGDDLPTPPTGQTVQAGFAGGLEPSAAAPPANLPPAAPPLAAPAAPAPGAPAPGAPPGFTGGGAPPVGGGAPGIPPVAAPRPAVGGAPAAVGAPVVAPPAAPRPATAYAPPLPPPADQPPHKPMAGPPGAPPPAKGERNDALAAFWLHMFPIGHLPVASYRPARQLPPPPEEFDYAAGLRFEPGDHPQHHLIDGTQRLADLKAATTHRDAARAAAESAPIPLPTSHAHYKPPNQPAHSPASGYPPPTGYPGHPASAAQPVQGAPAQSGQTVVPGYSAAAAHAGQGAPAQSAHPAGPAEAPESVPGSEADTVPSMRPVTPSAGITADHPKVQALLDDHDPLGGIHERDWDRRYLVRLGSVTPQGISPEGLEYNWPTSEQYPEGGTAPGEPEVLDPDTVIDRFGAPDGRVFAQDGTAFARRALPPAHKDGGYRRYRVRKPLPVWRALSAAWFGQPGGGVRYRTTHSAVELVALGYLEEIA